jgi:hypothetical protein
MQFIFIIIFYYFMTYIWVEENKNKQAGLPFQSAGSGIINRGIIKSVMEGNV